MTLDTQWSTFAMTKIPSLKETVSDLISQERGQSRVLHVGTDGLMVRKNKAKLVTAVVVHKVGKGGRVFFRETTERISSIKEKLSRETLLSLEIAWELLEVVTQGQILIHIDANPDPKFQSSQYYEMLASMVAGNGFRYVLKPAAWAASHTCDYLVRGKHKRNKQKNIT